MGRIVDWSPVQEITGGLLYDVRALHDGEEVGTRVPAWVARLIAWNLDCPVIVRVHGYSSWGPPTVAPPPRPGWRPPGLMVT